MAVIVGFRCNVISCDLAWRGAAEASACGCCSTVGLTLILSRGQFFCFCCPRERETFKYNVLSLEVSQQTFSDTYGDILTNFVCCFVNL